MVSNSSNSNGDFSHCLETRFFTIHDNFRSKLKLFFWMGRIPLLIKRFKSH